MKCDLKISAAYSGESTGVVGTIQVKYPGGQTLTDQLNCSGDASSRGTCAEIDGENHWWCGYEENECGSANIEEAVESLFYSVWNEVEKRGDADGMWEAHVVDGEIKSVVWEDDES
ncbi:MAG: hypothetical protein ACXABF_15890 [Candidatus Thorarchaeota archaeon]|jgi:hypothetical protein